jgi:hypothetical protein
VPGGAFVQVARGIYNGVMTFVEKGKQIAQVGSALLGSLSAIAAGQLAPAAQAVETTLVKVLPVALGFLARWLGLDGISGAIQTGLKKVQAPVEKAVTKVLDTVVDKAKAVWGAVKGGAGKVVEQGKAVATAVVGKVAGWLGLRERFAVGAAQHTLYFDAKQPGILFVASTPQSYTDFLTGVAQHVTPTSLKAAQAYQKAQPLAHELDAKLTNQAVGADITAAVAALLKKLVPYTIILMKERDAKLGRPTAGTYEVVYGGVTSGGGFGRSMTATFSGPAILSQAGSPPKSSLRTDNNFRALNERRRGGARYYVLGHLLSQELGAQARSGTT